MNRSLTQAPFGDRLAGLAGRLDAGLSDSGRTDALVVTNLTNIRWLTGFAGSNACLVIEADRTTVITDGRYDAQMSDDLAAARLDADLIIDRDTDAVLERLVGSQGRVALEADDVTWSRQLALSRLLSGELVPVTGAVTRLRMVKDEAELALLAQAADIADRTLTAIRPLLSEQPTEQVVASALDTQMQQLGADGPAFETIVASGPNSARPHARPSQRRIVDGDLVIIDMGARVGGYGSDMTRTFLIGSVPDRCHQLYDAVARSQQAGLAAVRDGVDQRSVDAACRSSLEADGLGDAFKHGTGHGIGLEIHEDPFLSVRSTGKLATNNVITVEPGAYLDGLGGVRIEDSVVVTAEGCRSLTRSPKEPAVEM